MGVPRRHSVIEIKAFIPEPDNYYFRFPLPCLRPYSGKERRKKTRIVGEKKSNISNSEIHPLLSF